VAPLDRLIHIRIVEDKQRRLAASLERDILHIHTSTLHDLFPSCCRASERHLVDTEMLCDRCASDLAMAIQNIDDAGREASFLDEVRKDENGEWCLLGRFHHNGVAASQRWA